MFIYRNMYYCKICGTGLKTVKQYVDHCKLHSNLPKIKLPCCFKNCLKTTLSYTGLRQHIGREHADKKLIQRDAQFNNEIKLNCSILSCKYVVTDRHELVKHLKQHIREGMSVECPINGCNKRYSVVMSFTCHLTRDHTNWQTSDLKRDISTIHQLSDGSHYLTAGMVPEDHEQEEPEFEPEATLSLELLRKQFTTNLALFFVKLKSQFLVPESTVNIIANELQNIVDINRLYVKQSVKEALSAENVPTESSSKVLSVVDNCDLVQACLGVDGILSSTHKRAEYVRKHLNYVPPQAVHTGTDSKNKRKYLYYVPIKESLIALLNDNSVMQQCLRDMNTDSRKLSDLTDGLVYKTCVARSHSEPQTKQISIILYQDAFEVANPLGSAKKKHKILGFYYMLGNLESHNRSAVDNMQLVLLGHENDITKAGHTVFRRVVDDLKQLETAGFNVGSHHFSVVVPAIAGDNLGSHWLGGFVTNFSSTSHCCRFCTITKSDMTDDRHFNKIGEIRTVESYNRALDTLRECDIEMYEGIKFNSIFNNLNTFHVCNPGLPPCIAHDLFEGVMAYDVPLILKYLVKEKKWLNLTALNKRLEVFAYATSDCKPAHLHATLDRLSGSASQNWCLLRLLPLIIWFEHDTSDREIYDDDVYRLLIQLRDLVQFVVAPSLSPGQVAYMKVLIEEYIEQRHSLFSNIPLRPKHHYLLHYASLTLQFGPLIKVWTLRFESKHQYFKRCVRNCHNFINVPKMLATRHQQLQAYLSAGSRFHGDGVVLNTVVAIQSQIHHEVQSLISDRQIRIQHVFTELTYKGTTYKTGLVLPMNMHHAANCVLFGEIVLLAMVEDGLQCFVRKRIGSYDCDVGCYVLNDRTDVCCVSLCAFADSYPLHIYSVHDIEIVVLKHQVLDI